MASEERPLFPVVIAGKDRTRMTCAVIDHIKAHLSGVTPYFICVSDRSREGHDAAIRTHLAEIGATTRAIATCTIPEGDRYGWGAAMNIGLELAFSGGAYKAALVVDNDWLLQKDLDIPKYLLAFERTVVGAITFKPIHAGTNIEVKESAQVGGAEYLLRSPNSGNTRFSFTAELGCAIITRRFWESSGLFQENCTTDETEWGLCNWYNALSDEEKTDRRIWFATDKALYYTELNGEGHVFTHVGLHSQHDGPQQWECPEEYRNLSDEAEDLKVIRDLDQKATRQIDAQINEAGSPTIQWNAYFDKIYCFHYLPHKTKLRRLVEELSRVGITSSGIFEFRYTTPSKNDLDLCEKYQTIKPYLTTGYVNQALELRRILAESIHYGYLRILILEDDVAFLMDKQKIKTMLEAMPMDAGLIQFDKFVNDGLAKEIYTGLLTQDAADCGYVEYTKGSFTSSACFALSVTGMKELLRLCDNCLDAVDQYFQSMNCKRYLAVPNLCVQTHYGESWSVRQGNIDYLHKVYKNCGVDYRLYAVPAGYDYGCVFDGERVIRPMDGTTPEKRIAKKGQKFVSVYAIAKNEAVNANRWFECVKEADEVCVLDTGSTDDTVEILQRLGAKVKVKNYEDWSFAVARNDSMDMVSPDAEILFTLDLDETIKPGWRKTLEDAWIEEEKKSGNPVGCIYKYVWSWTSAGKEAQSFSICKIHAKGTGKWKYRCHEILTEVNGHRFFLDGFVVEHHQNTKTNRSGYLPLLEKDAEEMPNDDRSAYYYARELMYGERWTKAEKEFERHLSLPSAVWRAERASSMRNIARCYEHLHDDLLRELWLWRAAEEDPTNREATFQLGVMALGKQDYLTAVKVLKRCVAIKEPSLEYISDPICWTAYPWFLYAQALWWTGEWAMAVSASAKALEIEPNNEKIKEQLMGMEETARHHGRL